MDTCERDSCSNYAWQATIMTFVHNINNVLQSMENVTVKSHPTTPKKLTTEAIVMTCMILCFIVPAVIGTTITASEFFFEVFLKKKHAHGYSNGTTKKSQMQSKNKEFKEKGSIEWLKKCKSYLKCFCIITNGRKILSPVSTEDQFTFMHGMRSLSMIWTIFNHICIFYASYVKVDEKLIFWLSFWLTQFTLNGVIVMDVFFVIRIAFGISYALSCKMLAGEDAKSSNCVSIGFLNAYFFCSLYERRKGKISWTFFYIHRFLRITPAYLVVLGFYSTLFSYMGSGPLWPTYDTNPVCKENWKWNLLFINNFQSFIKQCMLWSWYLATDMQLYMISPIFLVLLIRWPRFGYTFAIACICGSCFASFAISKHYSLVDGFSRLGIHALEFQTYFFSIMDYLDKVHEKPYTRLGSYLVGITGGHFVFRRKYNKETKFNAVVLYCGWITAAIAIWICFFALYNREESVLETAVHNGVKNLLLSCIVLWIIFVCITGQGGIINQLLSLKVFLPISRLTYCMYLINPIVIMGIFQTFQEQESFDIVSMVLIFIRALLWTLSASFIASLLFESPVLRLLAFFSGKAHKE